MTYLSYIFFSSTLFAQGNMTVAAESLSILDEVYIQSFSESVRATKLSTITSYL